MKSGSHGDISFYDELGVEDGAPAEQVRETYRSLVRLLHPDHQTDPQLKAVAEAQMRKLNRIYAILSDPEKRARYDESLRGSNERPTLVFSEESAAGAKRWAVRIALALIAVTVLAGVIWSTSGAGRDPADDPAAVLNKRGIGKTTGSTASDQTDELQQLRSEVHALETERNRALEELARLRGGLPAPPVVNRPAPPSPRPMPAVATSLPQSNFGGEWYWTRAMQSSSELRGSYQPDFIEATLTETNGVIRGSYRAKYRVPDNSVNPEVSFEFAATLAGPILICPWTGPGGARGEVMVRQTSANSLQVDWTANELGVRQRVSTGSAVLARKIQ